MEKHGLLRDMIAVF
jgi:glutaminase